MIHSDFKRLKVWQKGMDLVKDVYKLTGLFSKEEVYGLTAQIKRSSVSIPSNVAEGQSRGSINDFIRFLHYARGSAAELETQLLISVSVGLAKQDDIDSLLEDIKYINIMTSNLIKSLNKKQPNNVTT